MAAAVPIEIKPPQGGRLLSDLSAENVGFFNYTRKSEWRRFLDREIRSEGHDAFNPAALAEAPALPTSEPLSLCVEVLAQNGKRAVVVGTKTMLWRYFGTENGAYYDTSTTGYAAEDYAENYSAQWMQIGSGFSRLGRRWEAVVVAGILVLNNAVDLPVKYEINEAAVEPLWELREQGIASVGAIWKFNDILMCGDLRQINAEKHLELMATLPAAVNGRQDGADFVTQADGSRVLCTVSDGSGPVPAAGNLLICEEAPDLTPFGDWLIGATVQLACGLERTVVGVTSSTQLNLDGEPVNIDVAQPFLFPVLAWPYEFKHVSPTVSELFPDVTTPAEMIGRRLFWDSGEVRTIVGYDETSDYWIVDSHATIASGPVGLENPDAYGVFDDEANTDHFRWRTLWAMPGQPHRFAAVIPGTSVKGSNVLELSYPVRSLESGQDLTVTDAGEGGEVLRTAILFASGLTQSVALVDQAANDSEDCLASLTDSNGSIVGYDDLIGDGSGILRGTELKGYVVIAKETSFFVGRYTGAASAPFAFDELKVSKEGALAHRGAWVNVGDEYILYAGKTSFYRLDLTNRVPQEVAALQGCQQLFFDGMSSSESGIELGGEIEVGGAEVLKTLDNLDAGDYELIFPDQGVSMIVTPTEPSAEYPGKFQYTVFQPPGWVPEEFVVDDVHFWKPIPFSFRSHVDVQDLIFAVENPVTKEIWLCFPSRTEDNVLRFDTENQTVSTSSLPIASACAARKPENRAEVGGAAQWFIMGGNDGQIWRYGLTNEPTQTSGNVTASGSGNQIVASANFFTPAMVGKSLLFANRKCVAITGYTDAKHVTVLGSTAGIANQKFSVLPAIWHRGGSAYKSVLESGLEPFNKPHAEKHWTQYVPVLASQQSTNTPLDITLRAAANPGQEAEPLTTTLERPLTENLVTLILVAHYLGDRLEVEGVNNPCELSGRLLLVTGVDSRNFQRRQQV